LLLENRAVGPEGAGGGGQILSGIEAKPSPSKGIGLLLFPLIFLDLPTALRNNIGYVC